MRAKLDQQDELFSGLQHQYHTSQASLAAQKLKLEELTLQLQTAEQELLRERDKREKAEQRAEDYRGKIRDIAREKDEELRLAE